MVRTENIGKEGEQLAREYLIKNGYAILETNWRRGKNEADIIAYMEGVIVFVEVKTRSSVEHGQPEEFVDRYKQRAYIHLANSYVIEQQRDEEVRFDIIAIEMAETEIKINHIENAFCAIDIH